MSYSTSDSGLRIDGTRFRDAAGRAVLLRGVNLGGDSKVPADPDGRTHLATDFSDHRTVSFVGRPFPLGDARSHFARLAHWGFNCLRLIVTWEAIEHAGPGDYDEAFLDYFTAVCRIAGSYGFYVFIDFHQDVWSRMSGGDGAPGWTFEAAGLDFTKFDQADAAHVMQYRYDGTLGGHQPSYPTMSWSSNYPAPANAIMWTLFFAGDDVVPQMKYGGMGIQSFLQGHFLGAMGALAERLADHEHVIGFDTLNEPGEGWIGRRLDRPIKTLRGLRWSPLDGLAVASGLTRQVERIRLDGSRDTTETLNAAGVAIWQDGCEDPFRAAGIWDIDRTGQAMALKPDHFCERDGAPVCVETDYMVPFFRRVGTTIRAARSNWLVFAEFSPFSSMYERGYPNGMPANAVNAPHWYDYSALVSKSFDAERAVDVVTGEISRGQVALEDRYTKILAKLKAAGEGLNGGAPTLIGECGYQFDMNAAASFERYSASEREPGVWAAQASAFDAMFNAFDRLLLSATIWNYTASNRNDSMIGDGWNQEDLSIFSLDQVEHSEDPDSGGRAIEGFCRPYVRRAQGRLHLQRYDREKIIFEAIIDADPHIAAPTEIYLPRRTFGREPEVMVVGGAEARIEGQMLLLNATQCGEVRVRVTTTASLGEDA